MVSTPGDTGRPVRRALTPAAHTRLRRGLALIPVCVLLLYGCRDILLHLPLGLPGSTVQLSRDFIAFYVEGVIANQRNAQALYDIDARFEMVRRLVPGVPDARFAPIYGPQISVLFSPLGRLPYGTALSLWAFLSLAVYLGCGYAVWKACPRLQGWKWTIALLLVGNPGLYFVLGFGQISAIGLLCFTGAFFGLRANRPFVAGLAIGSLMYKPQLGLAAAFVFLLAREWRIILGAICGAGLQIALACAFWGPSIFDAYVRSLVRLLPHYPTEFEPSTFHLHGWRGFFDLLGLPGDAALAAYLIASLLTLIFALRCWRSAGPLAARYSALLVATVLVDPHVYVYDLVLLTPAFLLLLDWSLEQGKGTTFQWLLYFCYLSPLLPIVALVFHLQLSAPALAVVGIVLVTSPSPRAYCRSIFHSVG